MDGYWHKTTLQRYRETRSPSGHATRVYEDFATGVWLRFRTLSGGERLRAQQVQATLTHEVTMVYEASLVPHVDWRIVWQGRIFDIKDVRNVDEMNVEIRMLVSEVLESGPVSSPSPSVSPSASPSASPSS